MRYAGAMKVPSRRLVIIAACLLTMASLVGVFGFRALHRHHVATMLNIAQSPASVSDIDCASFGVTDVLERCAFRIAPADFDALLAGYRYIEPAPCAPGTPVGVTCLADEQRMRSSHTYCCGPKVGGDFPIAHTFVANPKEFAHGGSITVLADGSRSHVMADLYVE